jgi:hypothetical protein
MTIPAAMRNVNATAETNQPRPARQDCEIDQITNTAAMHHLAIEHGIRNGRQGSSRADKMSA